MSQETASSSTLKRSSPQAGSVAAWVLAARPKTLPAALAPVVLGTAIAASRGHFALLPALASAIGALLLQIISNFANDYFDHQRGADTPDRLGPTRVTASGLIAPKSLLRGLILLILVTVGIGLYLVWQGGWPIVAVGVAALLAALLYTGGPLPFGYYGLGDLFVFLFFGIVAVAGTYWVQALEIDGIVLLAAIPPGALITAILVVNNYRDIDTDRAAGKNTLAVRLGRSGTRIEYYLLLTSAYAMVLVFWLLLEMGLVMLLPWLTLPLAIRAASQIRQRRDGPGLNQLLAATARLSLIFSLLLAIAFLLSPNPLG